MIIQEPTNEILEEYFQREMELVDEQPELFDINPISEAICAFSCSVLSACVSGVDDDWYELRDKIKVFVEKKGIRKEDLPWV